MPSICVFGGSRAGRNPGYVPAAVGAGRLIARAGYGLVYGGGPDGIMGAVAEGAWAEGGTAIGVIPGFMREREGNDDPRLDVRLVETLAERKTLMADLSAGFLVLPGGLGTYDELFEAITWSQLGVQAKTSASSTSTASTPRWPGSSSSSNTTASSPRSTWHGCWSPPRRKKRSRTSPATRRVDATQHPCPPQCADHRHLTRSGGGRPRSSQLG